MGPIQFTKLYLKESPLRFLKKRQLKHTLIYLLKPAYEFLFLTPGETKSIHFYPPGKNISLTKILSFIIFWKAELFKRASLSILKPALDFGKNTFPFIPFYSLLLPFGALAGVLCSHLKTPFRQKQVSFSMILVVYVCFCYPLTLQTGL